MYGVVIWSDQSNNRAVIWCEDHGDLAYFRGEQSGSEASAIGPGDLVEFDLASSSELRLADAPRLVASRTHPTLAADLSRASDTDLARASSAADTPFAKAKQRSQASSGWECDVVNFNRVRCAGAA